MIDDGALIDEEAPGLVDEENAPEPLVDAVAPVIDPGIVEVGTLNGSQAAAAEVPPAEPFGIAQDGWVWPVPIEVAPELS